MNIDRSAFGGVVASAILSATAPAGAQGLAPASPQEIVAGTKSCEAATTATGLDPAKLKADGWRPTTVADKGQVVKDAGSFYGRGHLLLNFAANAPKVCFIVARVQNQAAYNQVISAMGQGLGVPGKSRPGEANTAYWFPEGHIVQMKLTGTAAAPSVRIAVGNTAEKK